MFRMQRRAVCEGQSGNCFLSLDFTSQLKFRHHLKLMAPYADAETPPTSVAPNI